MLNLYYFYILKTREKICELLFNLILLFQYYFMLFILKLFYLFTGKFKINEFYYETRISFYELKLLNGFSYWFTLHIGVDGISLIFIFLTVILIWICFVLSIDSIKESLLLYLFFFYFLQIILIFSFITLDFLFFYIFFEIILIPMFFLILIWGLRSRRILAVFFFFIYTAIGSIFILVSIMILASEYGTTNMADLVNLLIPFKKQLLIWIFLFFGFCIKIPMFPFHSWLPEAHVEAPTQGSILLAGILLKLGGYGFIRFLLPLCSMVNTIFIPFVYSMILVGIIIISLVIIRQLDMKKIIAYSSILHMNISVLGIFSSSFVSVGGSLLVMFGHGLISAGLFLLIGSVYERYSTRNLNYYGGLVSRMPVFVTFFLLFTLSAISFPGTTNYIGEFLIFLGVIEYSYFSFFVNFFFVIFFGAFYSFWLFNRVSFGEVKIAHLSYCYDLTTEEYLSLSILFFWILVSGCYPFIFLDLIAYPVQNLLILL